MARQKNSPESEASIQSLRKIRNAVFAKLSEKYPALTMVTSVGIPGNTTLRLERGGGAAFHYRDRFIVLVDRQYISPKDGSAGASTKNQVRVLESFRTIYNLSLKQL